MELWFPPADSHEFEQAIPPNEHAVHYESTYFVTTSRGWLKGLERLWLTNDAGLTWSPVRGDISFPIGFYGRKGSAAGRSPGGLTNCYRQLRRNVDRVWLPSAVSSGLPTRSPFFLDARTGWITVATYDEFHRPAEEGIAKTEDGGCTWKTLWWDPTPEERLLTAQFVDKSFGWVGGIRGRLLETRDSGLHWQGILLPGPEFYLEDFYLLDRKRGWVLGNFQSTFYYTLDAGEHWQIVGKSDLVEDQGAAHGIPAAWGAGLLENACCPSLLSQIELLCFFSQ